MLDEIAFIVATHERPEVARRCIASIREHMPGARIYVCDDSRRPTEYEGAVNVEAGAYDIGLSAKRNKLVEATTEPYVFLFDDDYVVTEETDVELFYHALRALPDVGIVGGAWRPGKNQRNHWFCGQQWAEGAVHYHVPPEGPPDRVEAGGREIRYHRCDFVPNWFMADRRTLEAVVWDEELKLQEHVEYFARLAAVRAKRNPDSADERARSWMERYERRFRGEDRFQETDDGRVWVYALATFRNKRKLSHLDGHTAHPGQWIDVDPEYASVLEAKGLAATTVQLEGVRPMPLPDVPEDVPLGVALVPDTVVDHIRTRPQGYRRQRERDDFWGLKYAKMGVSTHRRRQWQGYPYGERLPQTA